MRDAARQRNGGNRGERGFTRMLVECGEKFFQAGRPLRLLPGFFRTAAARHIRAPHRPSTIPTRRHASPDLNAGFRKFK